MEEQRPQQQLEVRGVIDILGETFSIYAKRFWKFVILLALAQIPVTLLALIPMDNMAVFVVINFVSVVAAMLVYGASICAVGQHYLTDNVSIGACYARVMWRAVSMLALAAILALLITAIALLLSLGSQSIVVALILLAATAVLVAFAVYMTTTAPAVIVEGYRSLAALRRGFRLARSSEWRILGHLIVYSLVALGLLIALMMPFLLIAGPPVAGEDPQAVAEFASSPALMIGSALAGILVPPIIYISTTLLYYDLRVRKEGYDVSRLSTEMGVSPV